MRLFAFALLFHASLFAQNAAPNPQPAALAPLGALRSLVTAYFAMDSTERGGLTWSLQPLTARANGEVMVKEKDGRKYLDFSKSRARVSVAPAFQTGAAYTLSAWVSLPTPDNHGLLWTGNRGIYMLFCDWGLGYWEPTKRKDTPWSQTRDGLIGWQHVAVTFDGTNSQAFLNGRALNTFRGQIAENLVCFGNDESPVLERSRMCAGVDEQIFFNRALSATELATVMNCTQAKAVPFAPVAPVFQGAPKTASALVAEHAANLVFVSDGETGGAGSGFVCEFQGKPALLTNIHVVAGMRAPTFKRLDNTVMKTVGNPASAVGHDILNYALSPDAPMPKLRAASKVGEVAAIGDEVFVLGNSEGARVIAPLSGTIVGIGPDLVEVTAEFVPGNSGSPIIHAKSGLVIGIATYLTVRDQKWLSGESKDKKVRRFGYRLDSVKNWQPVDWAVFEKERTELQRVQQLTSDLADLLRDMKDGIITFAAHKNHAIARHVKAFQEKVGTSSRVNAADHETAVTTFLKFMRSASQQDITDANSRMHYDYFRRAIAEEKQVRTLFTEIFDKLVKQLR